MSFLKEAIQLAQQLPTPQKHIKTSDDVLFELAVAQVDGKTEKSDDFDSSDKGLFGNRQIEFTQDVHYIPNKPSGDVSQPVGLLTQSDLNNYRYFHKGDRLSFRYKEGTSGACTYEAKKSGQSDYNCDFDWTDALIQELVDEGACKLI